MSIFEKNPFNVEVKKEEDKLPVNELKKEPGFFKKLLDNPAPESFFSKVLEKNKPEGFKVEGKQIFSPEDMVDNFFKNFMEDPSNIANMEKGEWGVWNQNVMAGMKILLDKTKEKKDDFYLGRVKVELIEKFKKLDFIKNHAKKGDFDNLLGNIQKFLSEYPLKDSRN